jgi:hypothetical protein
VAEQGKRSGKVMRSLLRDQAACEQNDRTAPRWRPSYQERKPGQRNTVRDNADLFLGAAKALDLVRHVLAHYSEKIAVVEERTK